jgi:hypothetical protein
MTATVLVSGKLWRSPERKTSTNGRPYVRAIVRDSAHDEDVWWTILCFAEGAQDELARLGAGESVSAAGEMTARIYDKDGHTRVGLTCFADRILSAHKPPREARAKAPAGNGAEARSAAHDRDEADNGDPNDAIPF